MGSRMRGFLNTEVIRIFKNPELTCLPILGDFYMAGCHANNLFKWHLKYSVIFDFYRYHLIKIIFKTS